MKCCEVLEGYLIRHIDGGIWTVKGCHHPDDGYVALPRFVDGIKVKRLNDSLNITSRYYRYYIKYLPELGREVPIVPLKDVAEIINPLTIINRLKGLKSDLVKASVELLELIASSCNCSAGLSGSLAGGYFNEYSSDIDIVIYDNHVKCYELIRKLRLEGILKPMSEVEAFKEFIEVSEGSDFKLINLIRKRCLQGLFKGYRYTLRLVRCDRNITLTDYITIPNNELVVKVINADLPYTTPAIYVCEVIKSNNHVYNFQYVTLLTHRIRYTEIEEGTLLMIKGSIYSSGNRSLINLDLPDTKVEFLWLD